MQAKLHSALAGDQVSAWNLNRTHPLARQCCKQSDYQTMVRGAPRGL